MAFNSGMTINPGLPALPKELLRFPGRLLQTSSSSRCQGDDQRVRVRVRERLPPPKSPLFPSPALTSRGPHTLTHTRPAAAAHLLLSTYRFVLNAAFYDAGFHSWGLAHTHTFYCSRHPTPPPPPPPNDTEERAPPTQAERCSSKQTKKHSKIKCFLA